MKPEDWTKFCNLWNYAQELSVNPREYSQKAMTCIFEELSEFTLQQIDEALIIHRRKSNFTPTICDVVKILTAFNLGDYIEKLKKEIESDKNDEDD